MDGKYYVYAALIAAVTSAVVNALFVYFNDQRKAARDSANQHKLEKFKRWLDYRENLRKERREQIDALMVALNALDREFRRVFALDPGADEDDVIEAAQAFFASYGQFRQAMFNLKGRIKRKHYVELEEVKKFLVVACLDLAIIPADRQDSDRIVRHKQYRTDMKLLVQRAFAAFENAQPA